jgi:hypothetical protein
MKKSLQSLGITMVQSTATSPAEVTGGEGIDASIAYRQFRESDNPYDPKFKAGAIGRATVGDPTALKDKPPADAASDQPDPNKQEQ